MKIRFSGGSSSVTCFPLISTSESKCVKCPFEMMNTASSRASNHFLKPAGEVPPPSKYSINRRNSLGRITLRSVMDLSHRR